MMYFEPGSATRLLPVPAAPCVCPPLQECTGSVSCPDFVATLTQQGIATEEAVRVFEYAPNLVHLCTLSWVVQAHSA
jgi:hypothetical protein